MESEKRGFMDKLSKIGREILEIQNKQDLDQNVICTFLHVKIIFHKSFNTFQLWTFNTQVCNASIYALRKEIQAHKKVKSKG